MPNYVEIATNPLTGRPYGEGWFDQARSRETASAPYKAWYTPAELDALYNPTAINQLGAGAPKYAVHTTDLNVPTITPDPSAAMLAALSSENLSSNFVGPSTSYAQQIAAELGQVSSSTYQQALDAALETAKQQAAFDAARYGVERPDAYRAITQQLYAQEQPDLGINSFIGAWESREPSYGIALGNIASDNTAGGSTVTPGAAQSAQASHIGDLNQFIEGLDLNALGGGLAAIASGSIGRTKSAGQIRREMLSQFSAVPQSALEGEAFATFSTPPAGDDGAYKGRIV